MLAKLTARNALMYYAFLASLAVVRNLMFCKIKTILKRFYTNVKTEHTRMKKEDANSGAKNVESMEGGEDASPAKVSDEEVQDSIKVSPADEEEEYSFDDDEGSDGMPSIRILIKVISTHELSELLYVQGIKSAKDESSFWSLHAWSRAFLLAQNLLSGVLVGLTSCMGKIFLLSCAHTKGVWGWAFTPCVWASGLSVTFTIFANLYNLNLTVSMYS